MTVMVKQQDEREVRYRKVAERGKPGTTGHVAVLATDERDRRGFLKAVLLVPMAVLKAAMD